MKIIKNKKTYLLLLFYSVVARFFNSLSSPLFPDFCFQGDNAIFYCMGREILRGKVLYKDMVDNKTPYTFFINTIGSIFEYKHIGIFIIEIIILFVTLVFVCKIVKLFVENEALSIIGAFTFSILMNNTYITLGMSKTECYVIPFTLIASYYLIKYYLCENKVFDKKFPLILGLCAGFSFMFNQKSIFFYMAVAVVLFIHLIYLIIKNNNIKKNNNSRIKSNNSNITSKHQITKNTTIQNSNNENEIATNNELKQNNIKSFNNASVKSYKIDNSIDNFMVIIKYIIFGLLGMLIAILPYIIYMIVTDSASHAYTCIFEMALNYISNDASMFYEKTGLIGLITNYILEYKLFFIFILISLIIVIFDLKNLYIKITYILALILTIYAIAAANNRYMYYLASLYIYLLPIYIFIAKKITNVMCQTKESITNVKLTKSLVIISAIITLLINIPIGYSFINKQYFARHNFNEAMRTELRKHYDDLDKIKVLAPGFNPEVYMAVNLHIDFPCFFTMNNTYEVAPVFYNQQLKYIEKRQPDVVVIRPTSSYCTFPEIMQEKIENVLKTDYKRIGDVDSKSNYGVYELYIKK